MELSFWLGLILAPLILCSLTCCPSPVRNFISPNLPPPPPPLDPPAPRLSSNSPPPIFHVILSSRPFFTFTLLSHLLFPFLQLLLLPLILFPVTSPHRYFPHPWKKNKHRKINISLLPLEMDPSLTSPATQGEERLRQGEGGGIIAVEANSNDN